MKHIAPPWTLTCIFMLSLAQMARAQTWQTVDDFQYVAGKEAYVLGMAQDSMGNIFAAGNGMDASGFYHALVMKSADGGFLWGAIDDYSDPNSSAMYNGVGYDAGIVVDAAGNLYAAGYDNTRYTSNAVWFVRRSVDGGLTWSVVDQVMTGGLAEPRTMAADAAGNIYVAGTIVTGSMAPTKVMVRKGVPAVGGGMTWATVDLNTNVFDDYGATGALFCHPTAGVFLVGSGNSRWQVRRSINGGSTWTTVDNYQLDSASGASAAEGIGSDAFGNLYVVGHASKTVTVQQKPKNTTVTYTHWIVRRSSDGGSSWTTVDDFQPTTTGNALANGFANDGHGNLFVIGQQNSDTSGNHWVVRKNAAGIGTWQTVENLQLQAGKAAEGKALLADHAGNLFASGWCHDVGGRRWVIRKGTP